ncbi:MAG TPA: SapC family protein, partial [Steroidobacteraceae bacterium]
FYAQGSDLAIDLDHPRVGADRGTPLFNEVGQPTKYLQGIMAAFQDLKPGIATTKLFIARLLELKLIEPMEIEVGFDDGTLRNCVGLYTVNQEVLARLPDEVVVEFFRRGYLRLIHLMIASLKQIPLLARSKNARLLEPTSGLAGARAPQFG